VPAGRVSNEIVHIVDTFTTLAHVGGAEIPKDRPIDGVDQLDFFMGKQENSNREGFPAYVANRLSAVKWRNWKAHLIWQENMYDPPQTLPLPKIINLLTDMKEERDLAWTDSWVAYPVTKVITEFEASLKKYPLIPMGAPRLTRCPPRRGNRPRLGRLSRYDRAPGDRLSQHQACRHSSAERNDYSSGRRLQRHSANGRNSRYVPDIQQ
jgi:hypothetical protein